MDTKEGRFRMVVRMRPPVESDSFGAASVQVEEAGRSVSISRDGLHRVFTFD
jgi:hypothetical protein